MAFDFKKEYKSFYLPKTKPELVTIPPMTFFAVDGMGNPNEQDGSYQRALNVLYALSYTVKMSYKSGHAIEGYFPYVVPPLEGLWWMASGAPGVDYSDKAGFCWTSMIRQPDFVSQEVFEWACQQVQQKKKLDTSGARLMTYEEGLCVQCMHIGSYDDEPATIAKMDAFAAELGYLSGIDDSHRHHEIYLGDPRKNAPEKLKTVIRHPVK